MAESKPPEPIPELKTRVAVDALPGNYLRPLARLLLELAKRRAAKEKNARSL